MGFQEWFALALMFGAPVAGVAVGIIINRFRG